MIFANIDLDIEFTASVSSVSVKKGLRTTKVFSCVAHAILIFIETSLTVF